MQQPMPLMEMRLRSRIHPDEMKEKIGKILAPSDINVVITGSCRVYKPNGQLLLAYVKNAVPPEIGEVAYPVLTTIRMKSNNRGMASGSQRVVVRKQNYAAPVMSSIIGYFDPYVQRTPFCRTTAWTGKHAEQFASLYPYFQHVAHLFEQVVPDRYRVQRQRADETHPDFIIPGTPYTTVTVNNTYPTGVHKDAGDLQEGFSCLTTMRRGSLTGGILCFPEFRVGVDMGEGDAIFMDAHEWHGNTELTTHSDDAERISCVFYYRTDMVKCGSMMDELERAKKHGQLDLEQEELAQQRDMIQSTSE